MLDINQACDTLGYTIDVTVRANLHAVSATMEDGQSLLGHYLKERLTAAAVPVASFATFCSVSRTFLYKVLNGEKSVSSELLLRMGDHPTFSQQELLLVQALEQLEI